MPSSRGPDPLVSAHDALGVATLAFARAVDRGVPSAWWRKVCRVAARPLGIWRARRRPWLAQAAAVTGIPAATLQTRLFASELEALVIMTRVLREESWAPEIRLEGRANLDGALERGTGAVLWVHRFQPFVHFVALRQARVRLIRPSSPNHGHFARSRFGARFLNGRQLRAEARYCERIVVAPDDLTSARTLSRRLAANGVVTMYADRRGRRVLDVPIAGGTVSFGLGAATLARHAGAELLPVIALAEGQAAFRVIIEVPLAISGGRGDLEAALRSHATVLERYVTSHADQWQGWAGGPDGQAANWRPAGDPAHP